MPVVPIKFKSDKEIEDGENFGDFKRRRHDPLDFEHWYDCYQCSKIIKPKCKLGIPYYEENAVFGCYPCVLDCIVLVKEKVVGDLCKHYQVAKCKEGFPVSGIPMNCPVYDGPKPKVEYLNGMVIISPDGKGPFQDKLKPKDK